MSRRFIGWFAASLVGGTVAGVALWQMQSGTDTDSPSTSPNLQPASDHPVATDVGDLKNISEVNTADQGTAFKDLAYHCPSVDGRLTEDCLRSLDYRYGEERTQADPLVPVCDQPTWGQVFSDPIGKRDAAVQALSRKECRSERNEIRSDADCARDAIAELAILHARCAEENDYRNGAMFTAPTLSQLVDSIHSEDIDQYRRRSQHVRTKYYRERWIAERCALIDDRVFSPIDELDGIYTGHGTWWYLPNPSRTVVIADEAVKGPIWQRTTRIRMLNQGTILHGAAARLGHLWALSEYSSFLMDDLYSLNPAQAVIYEGSKRANALHPDPRLHGWQERLESMWERLEDESPGIRKRFDESQVGHHNLLWANPSTEAWWAEQEPEVSALYEELQQNESQLRQTRKRDARSVRRTYFHASLMYMQRQDIQYNEIAIPEWAVEISEEELEQARRILDWLDEEYPEARNAPDPGAKEACSQFDADLLSGE